MRSSLDASVLVSVVFGDVGSDRLGAWLDALEGPPIVSDFCYGEFVAVVGRKVRSQAIASDDALALIERVDAFLGNWERASIEADDVASATDMLRNFDLRLRLPDALHIAITRRIKGMLVTTDRVQRDAARAIGLPVHDPLEDHA